MAEGDLIQRIIGGFGRYQLFLCALLFPSKFLIAFHQMAIIFLAPKVSYTCGPEGRETCPCKNPVYDTKVFSRTIIMNWHLICEKSSLSSLTQTLFQLGVLIGSVLFGMAADRFGRKKPFLVAVVIQLVAGVGAAYIPEYWTFTFVRFLIGMSVGGTMVVSFVIIMEFVGTQYRDVISALYQVPFNLGHMLLAAYGYGFRDFSHFQLGISIPALYMLSYFCFGPETPRWLIAAKRTDEAIVILERVAKRNERPTENIKADIDAFQAALESHHLKKGNILDLFRTPNLRKNIIAMSINWLACSYCFYGVSQYVGHLGGNVFKNVALSATVTMAGTFLSIPLMKIIGRRTILIVFNFICVGCLIVLALVPDGGWSIALACVGTVSSFIVFVVVYLYCSELFPTVVRNAAIGFCSMCARVGSMIAPFVIDLQFVATWMPPVGFALLPLVAGCATFFLPETKGCELMTTIEEGEAFGKRTNADNQESRPPVAQEEAS